MSLFSFTFFVIICYNMSNFWRTKTMTIEKYMDNTVLSTFGMYIAFIINVLKNDDIHDLFYLPSWRQS